MEVVIGLRSSCSYVQKTCTNAQMHGSCWMGTGWVSRSKKGIGNGKGNKNDHNASYICMTMSK